MYMYVVVRSSLVYTFRQGIDVKFFGPFKEEDLTAIHKNDGRIGCVVDIVGEAIDERANRNFVVNIRNKVIDNNNELVENCAR